MSLEFESDLHTHTIYSHGKGTIEDNVKAAIAKGLKTIGISDHGPAHIGFGVSRKKMAEMKAEIIRLRRIYTEIEILFGVEANILTPSGNLDINLDEIDYFDFVCAGWHYGALDGMSPAGMIRTFENFTRSTPAKATKKQLKRNTDAIVHAINTYDILFLTHPGDKAPVDLLEVAAACVRRGTYLEINTSHMSLTPEDIKLLELTDVKYIVNSDAHKPKRVGDFARGIDLINLSNLDPARIANIKKTD